MMPFRAHDPTTYLRYRPLYPPAVYRDFLPHARGLHLDVGCGTGASLVSLRRAGFAGPCVGIDPDPEMIAVAEAPDARFVCAGVGALDLEIQPTSISFASVLHWLDPLAVADWLRTAGWLQPGLTLHIYEYQFPIVVDGDALNAAAAAQFREVFHFEGQRARGRLGVLVRRLRQALGGGWQSQSDSPPMALDLTFDDYFGLFVSQARVLDVVRRQGPEVLGPAEATLRAAWGAPPARTFDFRCRSSVLRLQSALASRPLTSTLPAPTQA